jgi:dihydropyrimidinase
MKRTLIKNGTVCLEEGASISDVLIEDDIITDVGRFDYKIDDCSTIDAAGLSVLPGLIDIHTHLDDSVGGYRLADSWSSGSEIAIRNGITTLCSFITQRRGRKLSEAVEEALEKSGGRSSCDYSFHLTPVSFETADWFCIEKMLSEGFRTFKFYTTYRQAGIFTDYVSLGGLMARIKDMGAKVLVHCEDDGILCRSMSAVADRTAAFGHARSRLPEAETEGIKRVLEIAGKAKCPTHIVHVSTAEGARMVARAKQYQPVSCETCPQYLFLDESKLKGPDGHRFICSPPLRPEENRQKMSRLAQEGIFDLYATDHCAFSKSDKDENRSDFSRVPGGLPGIGALAPLMHELHNDFSTMAERLAANPARVAGLYPKKGAIRKGADADLALFSVDGPERPLKSSLAEVYEPYPGKLTRLLAKHVLLRGHQIVKDGEIIEGAKYSGKRV